MFGLFQLDLLGMSVLDFIHPGDKAKLVAVLDPSSEESNTSAGQDNNVGQSSFTSDSTEPMAIGMNGSIVEFAIHEDMMCMKS